MNSTTKPRVVLAILDGWGVGPKDNSNPIFAVHPQNIEYIKSSYLVGALQASGIAVGLPWGEVGNSEVGHITIGSGKIIYQHYPKISLAIENETFFQNKAFLDAVNHVKTNNSSLNVAGLLTAGSIHSAFDHLAALIEFASRNQVTKVNLHLFADGKDSPPQSSQELLSNLKKITDKLNVGVLASFSGRHYSLDRDSHWDRTKDTYDVMVGASSPSEKSLDDVIQATYAQGKTDQEVPPVMIADATHSVKDNDALIFFDFREDSIRQITHAFVDEDFKEFEAKKFNNLFVVTMTEYTEKFSVPVAFPNESIDQPLGKILAEAGKKQLLISESEKYAHVTYFFNGYQDEPFKNQEKAFITSNDVESHADEPEMKAREVAEKIIETLEAGEVDFIAANFANADMVAHTGNFDASFEAVRAVDRELGKVLKYCEQNDIYLVITADHGNVEIMRDAVTGAMDTSHDHSPVPVYIVGPGFKTARSFELAEEKENMAVGILSDVAPTILAIFGIEKPKEMTGQNLIPILQD